MKYERFGKSYEENTDTYLGTFVIRTLQNWLF